jgi:hypothetical protein
MKEFHKSLSAGNLWFPNEVAPWILWWWQRIQDEDGRSPRKTGKWQMTSSNKSRLKLFDVIEMSYNFLKSTDPKKWKNNEEFHDVKQNAQNSRDNKWLTWRSSWAWTGFQLLNYKKNWEEYQYMLRVVWEHRQTFPDIKIITSSWKSDVNFLQLNWIHIFFLLMDAPHKP